MSVKLIVLKSGEQLITDVKELVDERDNVVSVIFENPYVVRFLTPELLMEGIASNQEEVQHKVSFSPWLPLSIDKKIPISHDWILTIVDPIDWVKTSYENKMNLSTEGVQSENQSDIWGNIPTIEDVAASILDTPQEIMDIWTGAIDPPERQEIEVVPEGLENLIPDTSTDSEVVEQIIKEVKKRKKTTKTDKKVDTEENDGQ